MTTTQAIKDLQQKVNHLQHRCCCKSFGLTDGAPSGEPTNGQEFLGDPATGIIYYWDGDSWEIYSSGGGGGEFYFEVTYAEAFTLTEEEGLIPGALYKITDRGDAGIFLHAISTTRFTQTGQRLMLVPTEYGMDQIVSYAGSALTGKGIFNPWVLLNVGYILNNLVIFNGHYWRCLVPEPTIATIGPVDIASLQSDLDPSEWVRIEKSDPDALYMYAEKLFDIKYDFENDWIFEQSDNWGNVVGIGYSTRLEFDTYLTVNPIEYTDWGLADYVNFNTSGATPLSISENKCPLGFYNNCSSTMALDTMDFSFNSCPAIVNNFTASGSIRIQNNRGEINRDANGGGVVNNNYYDGDFSVIANIFIEGIYDNIGTERISYNNVGGSSINGNTIAAGIINNTAWTGIYSNSGGGRIEANFMADYIGGNTCGDIMNNTCRQITSNLHNGTIVGNRNNGYIFNCSGVGNIINNVNNGNIDSVVLAGDITDTIVNK